MIRAAIGCLATVAVLASCASGGAETSSPDESPAPSSDRDLAIADELDLLAERLGGARNGVFVSYAPRVGDVPHAVVSAGHALERDRVLFAVSELLELRATPLFDGVPVNFTIGASDWESVSLNLREPDATMVLSDIQYWADAREALGTPLSADISDEVLGIAVLHRRALFISAADDWEVNWSALRAVPDTVAVPDRGPSVWEFPGVRATGVFPTDEQLGLLDELADHWPLFTAETLAGVAIHTLPGDELQVVLVADYPMIEESDLSATDDWHRVVAAAGVVAESLQPVDSFSYEYGSQTGAIRFSPCPTELNSTDSDERLLSALAEAHPAWAKAARPGFCELSPY